MPYITGTTLTLEEVNIRAVQCMVEVSNDVNGYYYEGDLDEDVFQTHFTEKWNEVKMEKLRKERENRLKECDYIVLSDYPLTDKSAWLTYRQSLRDITEQPCTMDDKGRITINWPAKPE